MKPQLQNSSTNTNSDSAPSLFSLLFTLNELISIQPQTEIPAKHNPQSCIVQKLRNADPYLWQILPTIGQLVKTFVTEANSMDIPAKYKVEGQVYFKNKQLVYIGENTTIQHGTLIQGPAYIGNNVTIRKGAYIRANTFIGDSCLLGNSVEIKNSIIFSSSQIAHFNYIGDSILGRKAHFSAGSLTSNFKLDGSNVNMIIGEQVFPTQQNKIGALVGENVEIGCNAVLNPGSIICKNSVVYPLANFRGFLGQSKILKVRQQTQTVDKK